jgi:antitoxin HicB
MSKSSKFSRMFRVVEDGIEFEVQPEPEVGFTISVPSLPGCLSYGENREEAIKLIKDAIAGWLSVAREEGLMIPTQFENYDSYISLSSENPELQAQESKEVITVLEAASFSFKGQTENHAILFNTANGCLLSVPISPAYLPLGTKKAIIRRSKLSTGEILKTMAIALGMKNKFALNIIAIFGIAAAILFVSIPSHIYGISGFLLTPIILLSQMFVDRPNPAKVALIAVKVRTIFVLFIIPVLLFLYVWPPSGWIFFIWFATYLVTRRTSDVHRNSLSWNRRWGMMASSFDKYKGYTVTFNPFVLLITIVFTAAGLLSGYYFAGITGLWLGVIFAVLVWLLNPFLKNIVIDKSGNETPKDDNSP